jgi:hypothetical protein
MQSLSPEYFELVRLANEAAAQAYLTGLVIGAAAGALGVMGGIFFLRWYRARNQ